jgi:hypothetical protein
MSNDDAPVAQPPRHIKQTHVDRSAFAWCGMPLTQFDWSFADIDHATYASQQGSLIQVCPACVEVVTAALKAGKGKT